MAHYVFWLVLIPSVFFPINNVTPTTLCQPPEQMRFCKCEDIWQDLDINCIPPYFSSEERLDKSRLGSDLNRMVDAAYLERVLADSWVEVTQPGGHTRKIQGIGSCCSASGLPGNWNSNSCKEPSLRSEIYILSFRNPSRGPSDRSLLASYKITIPAEAEVDLTANLYRVGAYELEAVNSLLAFVNKHGRGILSDMANLPPTTELDYLVTMNPLQLITIQPSLRSRTLDEIQKIDFIFNRYSLEGKLSKC